MRFSHHFLLVCFLQTTVTATICQDLGIADGGFLCGSATSITYCSNGVPNPNKNEIQYCQPGLQCCQSTKRCEYSQNCSSGVPPDAYGYAVLPPTTTGVLVPTTSTPTPPPNYQPPPAVNVIYMPFKAKKTYPLDRTYKSWRHHPYTRKPAKTMKTHKKFGKHHPGTLRKKKHNRTYNHHYRTTPAAIRASTTTTTTKTATAAPDKPFKGVWMGSNDGTDEVGMPIGAVEGSNLAAQPYVGPLGGLKGYNNNNRPVDGAAAADLENIINDKNYPNPPIHIS